MNIPIEFGVLPIKFWNNCGVFWQTKWELFYDYIGEHNRYHMNVTMSVIISFCFYFFIGSLFTLMDITIKPKFLRKYKIQPGTNEPVDKERLKKVLWTVLFNQTVISLLVGHVCYKIVEYRGINSIRELPTFFTIIYSLVFFIFMEEIGFYYTHRLMHHKYLYKIIHKKHHEWTSPIALTATYCHPLEHIISNLGPVMLGPMILNSHICIFWIWYFVAITSTLSDHSGYHLPFLPSSEFHDFHHFKFTNCFGVLGLLDWLHNTDEMFRKTQAFKRHIMMFNFKSAREIFPDTTKKTL